MLRERTDDRSGTMSEGEFESNLLGAAPAALRLCRSLGRSAPDAAEIVQEAAMQAWRYRATLNGEWRPWFLSIVYRRAKRSTPEWLPLPPGWDRAGDEWPGRSTADPALSAALTKLPPRQRAALTPFYGEDMRLEAVARILESGRPPPSNC